MKQIIIENRTYTLEELNADELIPWATRVASVLGPAFGGIIEGMEEGGEMGKAFREAFTGFDDQKAAAILNEAVRRCITPTNEYLRDPLVFNKWFGEHKGDVLELSIRAVWDLSKDFFPQRLITMASQSPILSKFAQASA